MPLWRQKWGGGTISNALNCISAHFVIYSSGVFWLSQFIGSRQAIYSGCLVYIPSGLIKIFLLVMTMRYIRKV
jgi:biotin transport system substrate-specific component